MINPAGNALQSTVANPIQSRPDGQANNVKKEEDKTQPTSSGTVQSQSTEQTEQVSALSASSQSREEDNNQNPGSQARGGLFDVTI